MLKKAFRSALSLLLVFCLLLGLSANGIAVLAKESTSNSQSNLGNDVNGDGEVHYVSLGASNTNGYGHLGYLPGEVTEDPLAASKANLNVYGYLRAPENAYPFKVAKELNAELHQLAISSMRVEEVLYLLGEEYDYVNDDYMKWRFTGGQEWFKIAEPGGVDALRAAYKDDLTQADYITIDLGWNNFGVYAFNNIKTILADGEYWKAPDFKAIESVMTEAEYNEIREKVLESLENSFESDSESLKEKMPMMLDVLVYATLGAIGHYDSLVKQIYEWNPDVQIVNINIQNLADDLVVEFEGETLELGDLYGELIDLVNYYRASKSDYADKVLFADAGDVSTFLDEIVAWDGDPATLGGDMKDCFDMYDDKLYVRSIVEYMMVGQALSGVFDGFRTMAAGYGLEVFKDSAPNTADSQGYVYEFALGLSESELLSLDLAKLDLANPGKHEVGDPDGPGDKDASGNTVYVWDADEVPVYNAVELYGAAVAQHLKNLRGDAANVAAYDYVFEGLLETLEAKKDEVVSGLGDIFTGIDKMIGDEYGEVGLNVNGYYQVLAGNAEAEVTDTTRADFTAKFYADYTAEGENKLAKFQKYLSDVYNVELTAGMVQGVMNNDVVEDGLLTAADGYAEIMKGIEEIIPGAKAEFTAKLEGVYNSYVNTLNYAYDVVATIVQYAATIENIEVNADSLNGFNTQSGKLMTYIFNSFVGGSQNKFYYELQKNGVQDTGVTVESEFDLNEALFEDPTITAIAVLAVRYELGSSFFAHPNVEGHQQIADAVLKALKNGSDADEFEGTKDELYDEVMKEFLKNQYPNLYEMLYGSSDFEDIDDLAIIVQMLKMSGSDALAGVDLDALEAQIREANRKYADAHTDEEEAQAQAAAYELYRKLIALATAATATKYEVTEDSYYLSLGDSTITGYGLTGYVPGAQNGWLQTVAGAAHTLLATKLFGEEGMKTQFMNYCQGSLRADDLLLFLGGDVALDDYYKAEIEPNLDGSLEETQDKFMEQVLKADLISVAIGGGNFLTFAGKYMNRVMGTAVIPENDPLDGEPYVLDWARIGVDVNDEDSMAAILDEVGALVPIIDALGLMDKYLPEGVEIEDPAKFSHALAEGLLYGYMSYNYYYTKVLERIKEINPDAQLLILGMFNPVDDWTMEMDGEIVNIGGAVSNLMEMSNLQSLAFALQNDNTTFVDVRDAETILEAKNPGVELGFNDYYNSSFQSNGEAVHASEVGHEYIAYQMYDALNRTNIDRETDALLRELYDVLNSSYLTTAEKLDLLGDLYEAMKDKDALSDYPQIAVLEEIYRVLDANGQINAEQTLDIVLYTYARLLDRNLSDNEMIEIVAYVYDVLTLNRDMAPDKKVAIIAEIYFVVLNNEEMKENNALELAESLRVKLVKLITAEEAAAITDKVYEVAKDGIVTAEDLYNLVGFVSSTIFGVKMTRGPQTEGKTPEQKLAIIDALYETLLESDLLDTEDPTIQAATNLYNNVLKNEEIPADERFAIIDIVISNAVNAGVEFDGEGNVVGDVSAILTDVAKDAVEEILKTDKISAATKLTVAEKVTESFTDITIPGVEGMGGSVSNMGEYVSLVKDINAALNAAGYLADDESNAVIARIVTAVFENKISDEAVLLDIAEEVYFTLFGDQSIEDCVKIVVIIYNTLANKELVDIPTTGEAEDYFVELGGKVWEILDGNWADVIVDLEGKLDALYGQLADKTETLYNELMDLVELQEAELNKLIAQRDELNKKLVALKAELDAARNGGMGTYSVNTVQNKESELIEELKAAIAETEAAIDALDVAITALTDKIAEDLQGVAAIEDAIKQIKAEIEETETALNAVLAAIDELNADLKDVYDATLVLNAALENLYGMTLGQVDGKAVLEAVNTIIDTVPAIVENLELVYNKTQVAIDQVQAAIDTFNTFADNIQTNVDNIIAGVDELAGLTAEQLEAIKNAAAECQKLVKDFVDTNLPTVEQKLEKTYDDLEKLANEEIAKAKLWYENNQATLLIGAGAIALVVMPYVEEYVVFTYEDGKLSYTLTEKSQALVDKYTGILNEYLDDLRAARDEAQQWWDENYPKALEELNTKLDDLRTELENLDIKFENPFDDEYQAAKKAIEDEIKRLEALRDQLIEEGKKVDEYLIKVEGAISEVESALNGVINAGHVVGGDLMDLWNALTNLHGELVDLHDAVVDLHDATVEELFEIFNLCGMVADEFFHVLNTLTAYVDILVNAVELVTSVDTWHKLDEVLQNAVKDLADRLVEYLSEEETQQLIKDLIAQYGPVVAEQLLEALAYLFEEYGHDVAVAFYNYLYNNPEEVIAFFNEYGSLILDLIVEYGEVVVVITALALTWYGEDLATYLVENHETILANLAYWWNIHDEKMIDLLQVYAEALGLCDAVRDQIEILENAIESLNKELNDKVAEIEKELADLYEQLETATGAAKEAIEAKIAELEAKRDALIADITAKIEAAKKAIEALKAELDAAIAKGLADLEAVKDALLNLDEKVAELIEAAKKAALGEVNNAIANIEKAIENLDDALYQLLGDVYEDIKDATADLAWDLITEYGPVLGEQLLDLLKYLAEEYSHDVAVAFYNYLYNNPDEVIAFFNEYGDEIVELVKEYGDEALGIIAVALYLYGEDLATYLVENHETILANLAYWWNIHDEKMIDLLQVYAEALGLCDAVRDQIEILENAIESLNKELNDKVAEIEKELADLYEQLETATGAAKEAIEAKIAELEAKRDALIADITAKIEAAKKAIEALKAELENFINTGLTKIEDLKAAIETLDEKVIELVMAAKQAAIEELTAAAANVEAALKNLDAKLNELAGEVYEDMKAALKDLVWYLVDETIEAVKKYAPALDEALYNYLYNNPDEVIAFFNEYGYILVDLAEEYGDEALAVIGIALYLYGEDLATYIIENPEAVLADLVAWWDVYGDRIIAILQVYAEALGLCDAVRDEIANLENAIESLEKELNDKVAEIEKELADLYEQLETATGAVKEAIEAKIAALEAELAALKAEVEAKIAEVKAAIEELKAELDAAIAKGLADLEAVKDALLNLDEKVAELIEAAKKAALGEVNNAIANIEKAIENLDDALYQLLGVVYDDMKDALNELTLYLIDKLADAACKYFPEIDKAIYDYLYNHADEVIAFFQEYGYILLDLVEEYGEEVLGIIAYALYMYGEELADYLIENYDTILEGLLAWVEEYGERVAAMLQVYAEALGLCDAVRDQIADLEAKLEDLKAELENASEEVKAAIEAEIAKIEAAIEELKEKLEALEKAISNAIIDLNKTVEEIIDEVENLVEEIKALVEKIEQTVAEIKAMVETTIENAIDEAIANLEAAVETLKSEAKNLIAELKAYVDALVYDALHADYEIDEESEYVALGDGAYAELLGQYLSELVASQNPGYTYSFTDLSVAGSLINDLGAMIEANMDVIANADLISIGYGNETFAEAALYELFNALAYGTISTYDWVALVGPEAAAEVEKMLADVYAELVAQGMDITVLSEVTMATAVTAALECYAYNVVTYVLYLPEAINAIHAINPDALVVVVGMSNPFRGTTFAFGESAIVFDEYVDYLVHAANVECVTYAILNENTVYVPVAEAESTLTNVTMDFNDPFYLMNLLSQIISGTWGIEITEAGNEYIVEQIKNALNITVKSCHMLGDVNCDGIVDVEDAMLILQLEALLIDTTGLDVNVADVSGDGLIDVEDAMLILQYEAELIEKFPAEG